MHRAYFKMTEKVIGIDFYCTIPSKYTFQFILLTSRSKRNALSLFRKLLCTLDYNMIKIIIFRL